MDTMSQVFMIPWSGLCIIAASSQILSVCVLITQLSAMKQNGSMPFPRRIFWSSYLSSISYAV